MKFVGNSGSVENHNGIFSNSGVLFLRPEESDDDDDEPFVGRAEVAVQELDELESSAPAEDEDQALLIAQARLEYWRKQLVAHERWFVLGGLAALVLLIVELRYGRFAVLEFIMVLGFCVEIALRFYAKGSVRRFLRQGDNAWDAILVAVAVVFLFVSPTNQGPSWGRFAPLARMMSFISRVCNSVALRLERYLPGFPGLEDEHAPRTAQERLRAIWPSNPRQTSAFGDPFTYDAFGRKIEKAGTVQTSRGDVGTPAEVAWAANKRFEIKV